MDIDLSRAARRYLQSQPPRQQRRIAEALTRLAADPQDPMLDIAPLRGEPGMLRLRIGDCRALFRIDASAERIVVETIRPRGDVYKR